MNSTPSAPLPIYPLYCSSVSPTFGKWCPLRACDVLALRTIPELKGQHIYFYLNHPIKYIRLVGIIVAVDEYEPTNRNGLGRWIATLDDGSGVNIECVCSAPPRPAASEADEALKDPGIAVEAQEEPHQRISPDGPNLTDVDVGSVVKMKGGITEFREMRQMRLLAIHKVGDTNAEVKCWGESVAFKGEVLEKPWVLSPEQVKECEEEEFRGLREAEEERKRKERREIRRKKGELEAKTIKAEVEKAERREKRRVQKEIEAGHASVQRSGRSKENKAEISRALSLARMARLRAAGKYDALGL